MYLSTKGDRTLGDEALMERVRGSDAEAFAELYDRYGGFAFRVARSICKNDASAEDAVQEGFLSIWRSRNSYRSLRGGFKPWAISVVRNRAIDSLRRDAVRPKTVPAESYEPLVKRNAKGLDDVLIARGDREAVRRAIAGLPDSQAEVITLAFYGEISHSEIAAYLGLPPGTVKGRMRLGLEKLARQVSRDVADP